MQENAWRPAWPGLCPGPCWGAYIAPQAP